MIRLGICTSIDHAQVMKEIGYDYIELSMSAVAVLPDADYSELLEKVKAAPLPVEAMNGMLPGEFVLCSEEGTGTAIRTYLERAFRRADELGVKVVVFGSGKARMLPEGMSEEKGLEYLVAYLRLAGPIAASHGMKIAIEPLRAAECNIIHHVAEAQALAGKAALQNVGALADLYHMMQGNETCEAVEKGVLHCHIADNTARRFPVKGDGNDAQYEAFFAALKKSGYTGRVSIEGSSPEDFEAGAMASFLCLNALRS